MPPLTLAATISRPLNKLKLAHDAVETLTRRLVVIRDNNTVLFQFDALLNACQQLGNDRIQSLHGLGLQLVPSMNHQRSPRTWKSFPTPTRGYTT